MRVIKALTQCHTKYRVCVPFDLSMFGTSHIWSERRSIWQDRKYCFVLPKYTSVLCDSPTQMPLSPEHGENVYGEN